jgi:hypothetical protein
MFFIDPIPLFFIEMNQLLDFQSFFRLTSCTGSIFPCNSCNIPREASFFSLPTSGNNASFDPPDDLPESERVKLFGILQYDIQNLVFLMDFLLKGFLGFQ